VAQLQNDKFQNIIKFGVFAPHEQYNKPIQINLACKHRPMVHFSMLNLALISKGLCTRAPKFPKFGKTWVFHI